MSLGSRGEDELIKSRLVAEQFKLVCNADVSFHALGSHSLSVLPSVPGNLVLAKSHQTPLAMMVALLDDIVFLFPLEAQPPGTLRSALAWIKWRKPCSESQLHLQTALQAGPSMAPPTTTSSLTVHLPEPKLSAAHTSQHRLFHIETVIKTQFLCQHKLLQTCAWSQRIGVSSSCWSGLPCMEGLGPLPSAKPHVPPQHTSPL